MITPKKHDLPYFPFFVGDWRKAPDIRSLSLEKRALWFEMLCLMWESPRRGYLTIDGKTPIDDKTLARMVGEDISVITEIKQVLAAVKIYSIEEATGIIYNRRMVKDEAIRLSKSIAGSLGMESRYKNKRKKKSCYNTSANKHTNKSLTDSDNEIDIEIEDEDKRGEIQERREKLTPFQKQFISIVSKYPKEFKLNATEDIQWLKDRVENQPQFKNIDLVDEMEGWRTWLEAEHRKKQAKQTNTFPKSDFKRSLLNRLKKAVEFKATSRWKPGAKSDYPNPNDDPDRVKREAQRAIERTDEILAEREQWKKESTVNPTKLIKALKEGKSLDEFKRTLPNPTTRS